MIGELYAREGELRRESLEGSKLPARRAKLCRPVVEEFFEWRERELESRVLLPTNPFTKAAHYALSRRKELKVFLEHPGVPADTNHLERQIRPIAVGRKNWLFCWTELGAEYVGVFQSLLQTCRLQGLSPYHYLVDVLQRVDSHPASEVALLTPRLWKERFGEDPLLTPLERHTSRTAD
ncbi:MAG: transposase [Acidobacteriota bacterium]|nr:transposase [Acidobacteriota bacterium]